MHVAVVWQLLLLLPLALYIYIYHAIAIDIDRTCFSYTLWLPERGFYDPPASTAAGWTGY